MINCFFSLSCSVHQAETSRPPAVIRWRRSWRKPRRWLPRHCHRGAAPTALPSTVWTEGSQWGRARADWRLPQNTLPRYGGSVGGGGLIVNLKYACRLTRYGETASCVFPIWLCYAFCVLLSDFPQERCPVVLAPLLYPEKRDILMDRILPDSGELAKTRMESSLAEFIQEVGYGFCARWVWLVWNCVNKVI